MKQHDPFSLDPGQLDERDEPREQVLRIADITPFPRETAADGPRTGFALDESASGMCLQLEMPVPPGALLRVSLRNFDGASAPERIVRVVWCRARSGGRYNAGLEAVDDGNDELLCVEHARRSTEVDVGRPD